MVINRILELLEEGEWLDLKEIAQKSQLTEPKAGIILNFLEKFHFIEINEKQKRAKATPPMLEFLKSIKHVET